MTEQDRQSQYHVGNGFVLLPGMGYRIQFLGCTFCKYCETSRARKMRGV